METSKYLDELNLTREGIKNEPKLLEKAMEELKFLDLKIEEKRREVNEAKESIIATQAKVHEHEGRVSYTELREKLANESIESLRKKIETIKEKIDEKKKEIVTRVNENLFKMIEYAKVWNCSQLGIQYRKMQRLSMLEEMRMRKFNLKLELQEYMERKEALEKSTEEKNELERKLEHEKCMMLEKELIVKKQIEEVNGILNEMVNERDNELSTLDNQDKITFERLQSRIFNLKNSINYWGCRVENAQKSLNFQRKSNMDFDFELEIDVNEHKYAGPSTSSTVPQPIQPKRLYTPTGPKRESPMAKKPLLSSTSKYDGYQEMLRQKEQRAQEARLENMRRNSFMKLTKSSVDGSIKAEPMTHRTSSFNANNEQQTPSKNFESNRFFPDPDNTPPNKFRQFQFKKK